MYLLDFREKIKEKFHKIERKDKKLLERINKKILEIRANPHRFKPLSNIMKGLRRVHFGSFVLVYSIDEKNTIIILEDYDHHDRIYKN